MSRNVSLRQWRPAIRRTTRPKWRNHLYKTRLPQPSHKWVQPSLARPKPQCRSVVCSFRSGLQFPKPQCKLGRRRDPRAGSNTGCYVYLHRRSSIGRFTSSSAWFTDPQSALSIRTLMVHFALRTSSTCQRHPAGRVQQRLSAPSQANAQSFEPRIMSLGEIPHRPSTCGAPAAAAPVHVHRSSS